MTCHAARQGVPLVGSAHEPESARIDTFNKFAVGHGAAGLTILLPPLGLVKPDDALLLAAYLVALAEPSASHPFADVLAAVRAT